MATVFTDPHYKSRQAIVRVQDDALGDVALAAPAPRLSRMPSEIRHAGRAKGQDTIEVLSNFGFTPQEIVLAGDEAWARRDRTTSPLKRGDAVSFAATTAHPSTQARELLVATTGSRK